MFDRLKSFFKKKEPTKYAIARLIENTVALDSPDVSPLKDKAESYILYTGKLKQSLVSGDIAMESLAKRYLKSQGFVPPETLSECDKLIEEISQWH